MGINFTPLKTTPSLINTAMATAAKMATTVSATVASKIDGFKSENLSQTVGQKIQTAITSVGNFLRNVNTEVKTVGLSGSASQLIGKISIDGASWGAATVEQVERFSHLAGAGGEKIAHCLEKVGHIMGTALGVTAILSGVRGLASSARCYSRASSMDNVAGQLDLKSSVQKQLADDLKMCADLNRLRGKDKAICGALDVTVGISTLVAGAFSGGAAAPFAGLIGYGAGQVVKNSLRAYRTGQDTQSQQIQREHVTNRLESHAKIVTADLNKAQPGSPISPDNQARIKAFQAAGLVSAKIDITKASPALSEQLSKISLEKIESKFTENTETLRPEIKENSTKMQQAAAYAKTALLMAT